MVHPLLQKLHHAAAGRFPTVDGRVAFMEPLANGLEAIVAFTGHAVIATALTESDFDDLRPDGFGRAVHPEVMLRLAGRTGTVHSNDATLVATGTGPDPTALPSTGQWDDHPRVRFAHSLRNDVRVYGDDTGFVTISYGLAGRREIGVEVTSNLQGSGAGAHLIDGARQLLGPDDWLFAAVAPGNARSLRAFLAQGFTPIATEVLIQPGRSNRVS